MRINAQMGPRRFYHSAKTICFDIFISECPILFLVNFMFVYFRMGLCQNASLELFIITRAHSAFSLDDSVTCSLHIGCARRLFNYDEIGPYKG